MRNANAREGAVDTGMASTRLLEQRQQIREARSMVGASCSSRDLSSFFFLSYFCFVFVFVFVVVVVVVVAKEIQLSVPS